MKVVMLNGVAQAQGPSSELGRFLQEEGLKKRRARMSANSDVGRLGCRQIQVSADSDVGGLGCRQTRISADSDVGRVRYRWS